MPADQQCVYCRKQPVAPQWRPFCSKRCRMADLGHWVAGDYRVATTEARDGDDGASRVHDDENRDDS